MKEWNIQLFELNYDNKESQAVHETLESRWITNGPKTLEFERAFELFTSSSYSAVAVNSCTAALHLSLIAANISYGDDVVISALTFVSAANVVHHVGGNIVLADSASEEDWNVSLSSIQKAVTQNTKAVIVVHFAGSPCAEIQEIAEYCRQKNIVLIEDVAHAPGATVNGQHCGTFGDFGCYSFFTNKNISTGEGGMVLCRSSDDQQRISRIRSHGMSIGTLERYRGKAMSYDVLEPGLNYRIDEIRSTLGLVQLKKYDRSQKIRKEIADQYFSLLDGHQHLRPFKFLSNSTHRSVYHIFPILLNKDIDREKFMEHLKKLGIQTSIHYPAISLFSGLKKRITGHDRIAREISSREVTLPLHTNLTSKDVAYIFHTIEEYFHD